MAVCKWPDSVDLLAWWIFRELDSVPPGHVTPTIIKECMKRYYYMTPVQVHNLLDKEFPDFARQFISIADSPTKPV